MLLAPMVRGRKGEFKKEMEKLVEHGFTRARIDGELVNIEDEIRLDKRRNHTIEVVVDRLLVKPGIEHRLEIRSRLAMKLRAGWCKWRSSAARSGFILAHGVSRLRHQRSATGAAIVFLQQHLRRLPGVPRVGHQIRFRSRQRLSWTGRSRCWTAGLGPGRRRRICIHQLQTCCRGLWH